MKTNNQALADLLIQSGYRSQSNRYTMVSRLDRPDWLEHMAKQHVKDFPGDPDENFEDGLRWAKGLGDGAADHYRGVLSRDTLQGIPPGVYELVRRAGGTHGHGGISEYRERLPLPKELTIHKRRF